jgi:hypothetical protein
MTPETLSFAAVFDYSRLARLSRGVFFAHLHEVTIQLLDFEWDARVAFAEWDTVPPSPARDVLGLNGFFDHFLAAIDDSAERLYPEPRFS